VLQFCQKSKKEKPKDIITLTFANSLVSQNGFDGTRFDGISQPVLPPPPPGVAANAAQLAAMAGHSVALSQKKGSFLGGGTEGGYTFW